MSEGIMSSFSNEASNIKDESIINTTEQIVIKVPTMAVVHGKNVMETFKECYMYLLAVIALFYLIVTFMIYLYVNRNGWEISFVDSIIITSIIPVKIIKGTFKSCRRETELVQNSTENGEEMHEEWNENKEKQL